LEVKCGSTRYWYRNVYSICSVSIILSNPCTLSTYVPSKTPPSVTMLKWDGIIQCVLETVACESNLVAKTSLLLYIWLVPPQNWIKYSLKIYIISNIR
jgi:hypothetical protein